jgi:D-3-phosphoglycerate dehydrogenase
MVSAPSIAKERGIDVVETKRGSTGAFDSYIRVTLKTERQERSLAGTVFSDGKPRVIQIKGINMEAELAPYMLFVKNNDEPGFIGALGTVLGKHGINIASFNLGRAKPGGDAISLIAVDNEISDTILKELQNLDQVLQAQSLSF